jgi:hypothetical protein
MNKILSHIVRFALLVLVQVFILNQLEIGLGILIMAYPLFVFLLPYELNLSLTLLISFVMGICIDAMSNTFGLHTSSLLLFAYIRPIIFSRFASQEDYEMNREANIYTLGTSWFVLTFGSLLFIHHFWFFLFEVANLGEFTYILQKTVLSTIASFLVCVGLQIIFVQKPKDR